MDISGKFFGAFKKISEKLTDFVSNFQTRPTELTEKQKQAIEALKNSNLNQRERLIYEIQFEILECMICSELIGNDKDVWICCSCHHILHFRCVKKWVRTSFQGLGWKCVACQTLHRNIPIDVVCFCGKVNYPKVKAGQLAHSCGKACGKLRECKHPCKSLCHPGPCEACQENVLAFCYCGKESKSTACHKRKFTCENICWRPLRCRICNCMNLCHSPPCKPCQKWLCYFKVEIFETNQFVLTFILIILLLTFLDYCRWSI
jgi:transcriptional repressor NF-X1